MNFSVYGHAAHRSTLYSTEDDICAPYVLALFQKFSPVDNGELSFPYRSHDIVVIDVTVATSSGKYEIIGL